MFVHNLVGERPCRYIGAIVVALSFAIIAACAAWGLRPPASSARIRGITTC